MSSDTKEYTHSSYFFRKDIINEFTEKNITNKYRLRNIDDILKDCQHTKTKQQLIVDTIQYLFTNICTGVGSSYSEKMITKFINNDWMYEHNFISELDCKEANEPKLIPMNVWGKEYSIKDLKLKPAVFLDDSLTCKEAIEQIKKSSYD